MARFVMKYRTYNFVNKNPVIDKVRTILQDEGLYNKKKRRMLHQLTGVSTSTYDGWFEGDVKNPQHITIAATVTALGYEEQFVKTKDIDQEAELQAARAWLARQKDQREKFKAAERSAPARKSNGTKRGVKK
jgi:hypothetical protein